jgi:hypothetical protein
LVVVQVGQWRALRKANPTPLVGGRSRCGGVLLVATAAVRDVLSRAKVEEKDEEEQEQEQ